MTNAAVDQLLYLMDEAFGSSGNEQSLLTNLKSIGDEDWDWQPPGGDRTISAIVWHVAACKHMYDHHAFGPGIWTWADQQWYQERTRSDLTAWLKEGHSLFRGHVAALADHELRAPRRANWGEMKETRWLIAVMIEHDLYHAGEINHHPRAPAGERPLGLGAALTSGFTVVVHGCNVVARTCYTTATPALAAYPGQYPRALAQARTCQRSGPMPNDEDTRNLLKRRIGANQRRATELSIELRLEAEDRDDLALLAETASLIESAVEDLERARRVLASA